MPETEKKKRDLLDELNIDVEERKTSHIGRYLAGVIALGIIGGGAYMLMPSAAPEQMAQQSPSPSPRLENTSLPDPTTPARPKQSRAVSAVLDANGYVVARRQAAVSSKTTGRIRDLLIEEGMHVEKGQLLARLDDEIARSEYDLATAELEDAKLKQDAAEIEAQQAARDLVRARKLSQKGFVSQSAFERAEVEADLRQAQHKQSIQNVSVAEHRLALAKQVLSDTEIRAPFSGVITEKSAQPGEIVSPVSAGGGFTRTGIGTVVDMASLEVEVDVNESFIDRIAVDQPATITLNSYSENPFAAKVAAIIPSADRNKATIRIRVSFLKTDSRIFPGMGVRVTFSKIPPDQIGDDDAIGMSGSISQGVDPDNKAFQEMKEQGQLPSEAAPTAKETAKSTQTHNGFLARLVGDAQHQLRSTERLFTRTVSDFLTSSDNEVKS